LAIGLIPLGLRARGTGLYLDGPVPSGTIRINACDFAGHCHNSVPTRHHMRGQQPRALPFNIRRHALVQTGGLNWGPKSETSQFLVPFFCLRLARPSPELHTATSSGLLLFGWTQAPSPDLAHSAFTDAAHLSGYWRWGCCLAGGALQIYSPWRWHVASLCLSCLRSPALPVWLALGLIQIPPALGLGDHLSNPLTSCYLGRVKYPGPNAFCCCFNLLHPRPEQFSIRHCLQHLIDCSVKGHPRPGGCSSNRGMGNEPSPTCGSASTSSITPTARHLAGAC